MGKRVSISKIRFNYESSQLNLIFAPNDPKLAKISNLYSQIKGKGHASKLLNEVVRYADKHGIHLWLEVQRYGDSRQGLDNKQLIKLYESFGFDVVNDGKKPVMMGRYPISKGEENAD